MPFKTCGPNEVLVVSGCCLGKPLIISNGGSKFVFKGLQTYQRLSLNVKTIIVMSPRIYTKLGVPITVTGVAQVKIESKHKDMLKSACEAFLSQSSTDVTNTIKETLEAHQRAIMGLMTVEEIYMDRQKFSEEVFRVSSADLMNLGISVVSYTIKDVSDDEGYLKALGQPRTAQVIRDARIGEAEAKRDAEIRKARADLARKTIQLQNDSLVAKAECDFLLKKAEYDKEVNTKRAIAERSYQLQETKTRQEVQTEIKQIEVIERDCQIKLEELKVDQIERQCTSKIRKVVEAEKYRLEKLAQAKKTANIRDAEAEAERTMILGEAKAFTIEVVGKANAVQMTNKAEAYALYQKAAKVDMILQMLPCLVAEISNPIASNTKKITMVSSGDDAEIGISKIASEVMNVAQNLYQTVSQMSEVQSLWAVDRTAQ